MLKSSVSNVATGLILVHITGTRPIAIEIARTRSLSKESTRDYDESFQRSLDVTERRSHHVWCHPNNVFDHFFRPAEFSDDLVITKGSQGEVAPCVDGDLVTGDVFGSQCVGVGDHTGACDEHRGLELLFVEVGE